MISKENINTKIKIKTIRDLPKLKVFMGINNLGKPNFSELARKVGEFI